MSKLIRRALYHSPFRILHVSKANSSSRNLERDSYLTITINGRDTEVFNLHIQKIANTNTISK